MSRILARSAVTASVTSTCETEKKPSRKRSIISPPCTPATAIAVSMDTKLILDSCGPRPAKIARPAFSPLPTATTLSPPPAVTASAVSPAISPTIPSLAAVKISPVSQVSSGIDLLRSASSSSSSLSYALSPPPVLPPSLRERAASMPLVMKEVDEFADSLQIDKVDDEVGVFVGDSLFPTLECSSTNSCARISVNTLADALSGKLNPRLQKCVVVDCRFDYEHKGGHIINAINTICREQMQALFQDLRSTCEPKTTAIVFHCEFSKHRAPKMSSFWRELDRKVSQYPNLVFPHVYILDGGYKEFFQHFPDLCEPRCYVSMFDGVFQNECKEQNKLFRKTWNSRRARSRVLDQDAKPPSLQQELHFS